MQRNELMPETWVQMLTIVGANLVTTVTLFLWCRHEAGEDRKIVNEDRREILQLIREIREDVEQHKRETDQKMYALLREGK